MGNIIKQLIQLPNWLIKNLKMKNKIIILCFLMIISSTMFTGAIVYRKAAQVIEHDVNKSMNEILQQSTKFMDEKLKSILIQIHFMQMTDTFDEVIRDILVNRNINYAIAFSKIEPLLTQITAREKYVDSIIIPTPLGNIYNTMVLKHEMTQSVNQLIDKIDGLTYWGTASEITAYKDMDIIPVAISVQVLSELDKSQNLYIIIHLKGKVFNDYFNEIVKKTSGEIYIINKNNEIVTGTKSSQFSHLFSKQEFVDEWEKVSKNGYFKFKDKEELLINVSEFSINDWKMVSIQKESVILDSVKGIKILAFSSMGIFIFLTAILSVYFARNITNPMRRLQRIMENAPNNNFEERFDVISNDEVGQLGKSFNAMEDRIIQLLNELQMEQELMKNEQIQKRKAELKALQAQINPHFLYNALDSIYWRSLMQGNEVVSEMAISLSNLFRIGLNKGQEITTVEREIEHVRNYLNIQKIIYEEKFDYIVQADDAVNEFKTVKLILQPLVENSIIHGFKNMNNGGFIKVNVSINKSHICYEVNDNGCGFEHDDMLLVLESGGTEYKGYALKNVFQRIQLHYGEQSKFLIESVPFVETKILIYIPIEEDML